MPKIPSPGEVGLPEKFDKWRPGQEEAIALGLDESTRCTAICAPTGHGKSADVVAIALLSRKPTCIVTASRSLEDQYMRDFACIGMVDIRGRNNYKCDMRPEDPGYSCEQGYAARCPYKGTVACDCSRAEMAASASSLVVTNYAKWCSARRFGQGMAHFQQVIFDEGHESYDALSAAMQVVLNYREIEENLKLEFPDPLEAKEFHNWKTWASYARGVAEVAMIAAQARITGLADPKPSWVKHFTHMRNLTRRLATLATANVNAWIVDEVEGGYQFDPISPGRYAEAALLLRVPRIIFVSATLRPKTMYMLGIGKEQFKFKEFDSNFDPRRSPIYYVPTMRVDSRSPDKSILWTKLDQMLAKRRDRKGIVQTTSYEYQKDVERFSRFKESMILNPKGDAPTEKIEEFKGSSAGSILVSPSVGMGHDFPGDLCRFQAILKVPFEPPSKILEARQAEDKEYRCHRAMQKIVQQLGRDVRSDKDWSERFIFDDHWEWFHPRYGHLAPASFHAFVKRCEILPQPPRLGDM